MAQEISIRVADSAAAALRARAASEGTTLEQYVQELVEAEAFQPTVGEVLEEAAREPSSGVSAQEIVDLIRADRESR